MGGAANPAPMAQPGQNVYDQSANAYTGALQGTQAAMGYQPQQVGTQFGYTPETVSAGGVKTQFGYTPQRVSGQNVNTQFGYDPGSVSTTFGYTPSQVASQAAYGGMSNYANPYTQQVIDTSMAELERQRQIQMGGLGAQASAARAFGGSRQGVAEALTNEGFARQGGQLSSQLYNQGFQTALGASQQDIANSLQAQMSNQQAGGRAAEFGQQTSLQAQLANQAARAQAEQFAQSTGLQASLANQQTGLQAALANQAATAQAQQFGQSTGLQAQGMNQQTQLQAALANQAAQSRAQEFGQSTGLQAALANQQAGLQGAQQLLGASGQLGDLSSLGFNFGQQIGATQSQEGQRLQAMNQALIDAAKGQFGGFTGAPQDALSTYLASLGGAQTGQQTQTQTNNPGLLQFLSLGLGLL